MSSKKPMVAILGCGPAGLIAAQTLASYGVSFSIFSRKIKSQLGGAQYLHEAIPGYMDPDPEVWITYDVRGEPSVYQAKVYGSTPVPFVSMEGLEDGKKVPAWNLGKLYDRLWDDWSAKVTEREVGPGFAQSFFSGPFDAVLSSVPLPSICMGSIEPEINHWFRSAPVRILNEAYYPVEDNTIVYDGTRDHSWYRASRLFGVESTEWGGSGEVPPIPGLVTVNKPIATNCDCHSDFIRRIGRFGTWQKGVLTHHAYRTTVEVLEEHGVAS